MEGESKGAARLPGGCGDWSGCRCRCCGRNMGALQGGRMHGLSLGQSQAASKVAAELSREGAPGVLVLRALRDFPRVVLHAQELLLARRLPDGSKYLRWRHLAAVVVQFTLHLPSGPA